jgi:hypothetical protein
MLQGVYNIEQNTIFTQYKNNYSVLILNNLYMCQRYKYRKKAKEFNVSIVWSKSSSPAKHCSDRHINKAAMKNYGVFTPN